MKSTPEERRKWKEDRRFRNWQRIIDRLSLKINRSQWALNVSDRVVKELAKSDRLPDIQMAIRRAN